MPISTYMPVERSEIVALTRTLVETPSENPGGTEGDVAALLAERLRQSAVPFDVDMTDVEPGRPNVVARAGDPDRGSVLLTGHMDVVPADPDAWTGDPYVLREDGNDLIGRGVVDMKGALAAKLLATGAYFESVDAPGEVVLAFVVDEEYDGLGARSLVSEGLDVDWAIIGEPTDLDVCVAQKGVTRYRLRVDGRSSHSGRPDMGVNSIDGLRRVLDRVAAFHTELQDETSYPELLPETISTTEIESTGSPNTIPATATATVDWRFNPDRGTDPEPFERGLSDAIGEPTLGGDPVDVSIEPTVFARAAAVDVDHDLVDELIAAAASVDVASERTGFNAATDARFLVHDAGIPTVLFGPGSIQDDAHTVDESVDVDDLIATADTYERVLHRLLA